MHHSKTALHKKFKKREFNINNMLWGWKDLLEDIGKLYQQSVIRTLKDTPHLEMDRPSLTMNLYRVAVELPI